jgi:hypothetical protein
MPKDILQVGPLQRGRIKPVRRLGVLMSAMEVDPDAQARVGALRQGLKELGWVEGRNLVIDYRWGGTDVGRMRIYATELVASALTSSAPIECCKGEQSRCEQQSTVHDCQVRIKLNNVRGNWPCDTMPGREAR